MSGDLKERIEKLLAGLGDTPDAVADSLRARGIFGIREEGCHCPIANLIRAEFPESREANGAVWAADGDPQSGQWFVCQSYIATPEGRVYPPVPVSRFIDFFDAVNGPLGRRYEDIERTGHCVDCKEILDAEELLAMAIRCDACANAGAER